MHGELWTGNRSESWAYGTEEPCQTRRVALLLTTPWPGSQPYSQLRSLGWGFSTQVFLQRNRCQALQIGSSQKHSPVTVTAARVPCPAAWPGLQLQSGSPWQCFKVRAVPGSATLSWPLQRSGHGAIGGQLSSKALV